MDPWLESPALWPDFHHELASALRHVITPLLPAHYFVKIVHRRVTDFMSPEALGVVVPDASVLQRPTSGPPSPSTSARTSTIAKPVEVELELPVSGRQPYLEIVEVESERVVTAIEVLSPSNKRPGSRDRARYLRKRDGYLASEVHFLEIDLIRGGERWHAGHEPQAPYRVLLSRAERRPRAQVWPIGLRERLPLVPVPLGSGDQDVALDLQGAFDRAYDEAGYRRFVPYGEPTPAPPLAEDDLAWARSRIRGA
jgi:hypothetical protein